MNDGLLLDALMPEFDATRRAHRVVDATPHRCWEAALDADFLAVAQHQPVVRALIAARGVPESIARWVRGTSAPPEPVSLRLADMPTRGDWVRLGDVADREVDFGVIGRFWTPPMEWLQVDADDFATFDRPGYAKIGCALVVMPYGESRTLVTYEARTLTTDEHARVGFRRYWRVVAPFVGVVLAGFLGEVARIAERP